MSTQIIKSTSADVIPATLHGFAVRVGIGPYPPDAERSHRRAVYAELTPISAQAREAMSHIGRVRILATTPLSPAAAAAVQAEPDSRLAELLATQTLANASRLARQAIGA